jgi:putative PIN family toxin of toxin-antitoxin system
VIRAVLDTNVLISAILVSSGIPARILMAAFATVFSCFASDAIVGEVLTTLGRERVQRKYRLDPAFISKARDFLESRPVLVQVTVSVSGVATHPEDDVILATAVSARADYLVTGDRQLLALQAFQGVQIVSPREFLAILGLPESAP